MALQTSGTVLRTGIAWTLQGLLALVFMFTAYRKFTGHPVPVETIEALGADQWVRIAIGILELLGAIGLLVPRLAFTAATGLSFLMLGATGTHLFLIGGSPVEALILFTASVSVVVLRTGALARPQSTNT